MSTLIVSGVESDCIHRKYESVNGHTACLDIDTSNIVEKGIRERETIRKDCAMIKTIPVKLTMRYFILCRDQCRR